MNHKTGRMINRYARITGAQPRAVKRAWRSANRWERTRWRKVMKRVVAGGAS